MIWRAGLQACQTEIIPGVSRTRIETELFVTDKEKFEKLPPKEVPKKKENVSSNKPKSLVRPSTAGKGKVGSIPLQPAEEAVVKKSAVNIGQTFKALKPEVQTTLDKIFTQVELVSHTLNMMEKRIAYSEDRMMEVMNYMKDHDVSVRPKLVPNYPSFLPMHL